VSKLFKVVNAFKVLNKILFLLGFDLRNVLIYSQTARI
jgi:hypothetical protein